MSHGSGEGTFASPDLDGNPRYFARRRAGHSPLPDCDPSLARLLSHARKQTFAVLLHRQDCAHPGHQRAAFAGPKADLTFGS